MRMPCFGPLNPFRPAYAVEGGWWLPFLARGATAESYLDKYRHSNAWVTAQFAVRPASEVPAVQRAAPYDSLVYQMGNSPAHAYIYDLLGQ